MAVNTVRYSYTDANIWMRAISDAIEQTDPLHVMLPKLLGFGRSNANKFQLVNWPSTKVEWITDSEMPRSTIIAEALDDSEEDITLDTGNGGYFKAGDIILIDDEMMYVTSVSTDTLNVTRGYGDTTAAAHDDDSAVKIVMRANEEGGSFPLVATTTTAQLYNYTQIFRYRLTVSRTQAAIKQYGIKNELAYRMAKLWNDGGSAGRAAMDLEDSFYYGQRVQRTSSGGATSGSMGGFRTFVSTHTDTAGGDITKPRLHEMLRSISDEGGTVEYIMGTAFQIEKIVNFYDGYRVETQDSKIGGYTVKAIETPFMPPVKLLNNYRTPDGHLYLFNSKDMGWVPLDEYQVVKLPNSDDVADDQGLVGELTFILKNERHQGYFTGLNAS